MRKKTLIKTYAPHGGIDTGSTSVTGSFEKDINLDIVLKLNDMLKIFGFNTELTRETDKSIHDSGVTGIKNQKISDMDNRLELINSFDNSIFISIHQNEFTEEKYSGAQMFYSLANPLNERLAAIMQEAFVSQLQPENTRETKLTESEIFLTYNAKNPSLMVECGFLSNNAEALLLDDEYYRSKVAFTVFCGIESFVEEEII